MKTRYADYTTALGNDLKRIFECSLLSFFGLTAESSYHNILLDPAIKPQDDRKASSLVIFAM
jgi:hypothetical protein